MALQALLALGGLSCSRRCSPSPISPSRVPGTPEDLSGALADPEPLFAAPTRLDRIGRVMTHVKVNGKGPFRFVIDTGASRSTLAPHLARALNLQHSVGRNVMLNGVTGAAEVPTVAVDSIEIGALQIREPGPAGHLHFHHGQCRRHPRRRRIPGSAHRRRLQTRSRERARVQRPAASLQHGDRARHAITSTGS